MNKRIIMDEEDARFNDALRDISPNRGALGGDGSQSSPAAPDAAWVDSFMADFRGSLVAPSVRFLAEEIVDWFAERHGRSTIGKADGQNASAWKAAFVKILKYFYQFHCSPQTYAALRVWDEPLLDDIVGHLTPVQIAAHLGVTKAAINNAEKDAREHFGRSPRRDQRKPEACKNMSRRRIENLKKKNFTAENTEDTEKKEL